MAISTKKKNKIIAEYKTGAYSLNALAKKHKVAVNSVKKFCDGVEKENAELVELCLQTESAKCIKTAQDLKAVDEVVKNRLQVYDISNSILKRVEKLVKGGKAQKVLTDGAIIEYDLQAKDYKDLQDTVDKASITLGVNQRFSQSQVNIQNNNQNKSLNTIDDFYEPIKITFVGKND